MRRPRREGLAEAFAARRDDPAFRRALADLRETCAFVVDPRHAERDLARLVERYAEAPADSPVSPRFEAVIHLLQRFDHGSSPLGGSAEGGDKKTVEPKSIGVASQVEGREGVCREHRPVWSKGPGGNLETLLADGLRTLLAERLSLPTANVLDPWAGDGRLIAALNAPIRFANVANPALYARAVARLGPAFDGLCLADSFRLPPRVPTPGFDFSDDENNARVSRQQGTPFQAIVSDLREWGANPGAPGLALREADGRQPARTRPQTGPNSRLARNLEKRLRWMADRLAPKGILAFLSDGAFVDEPTGSDLRAWMEREFALVAHLALKPGQALTFLARGGAEGGIRYAEGEPTSFAEIEWRELHPTERHVWRTEILRPEWATFLPLTQERGAVFGETPVPMPPGTDAPAPGRKGERRVLRNPLAPAWRVVDRKARREPVPTDGPRLILLGEPFGVFASRLPIDAAFGGEGALSTGGRVSAAALRSLRNAYGAGIVEGDVLEFALALLHHPEYRTRYHEDLRRGVPRLPLIDLEALVDHEDAPPVGPGTAFGTGWLRAEGFEPGTLPDYDDPFASPYARADVEPGFLLMVGLGAALFRLQTDVERLLPHPMNEEGEPTIIARPRISAGGTRLVLAPGWTLDGIPPEASLWRIGRKSALEWAVDALKPRRGFDPNRPDDPRRPARLVGGVVAASLEIARLTTILESVPL